MSTYFYQPCYKIEFWSGSTKLRGFGYSYANKEVVSFRIKPGLTKALGSFEIELVDTGSDSTGMSSGSAFKNIEVFDTVKMWYGYTGSGLTPQVAEMFKGRIDTKDISYSESACIRNFSGRDMGEPLTRTLERRMYTGSLSSTVGYMQLNSGLDDDYTYISSSAGPYTLVMDNTSDFDGLMEISDYDNKDFYIDTGSRIHWFEKNSYVDTGTSYEEGLNIINYRFVKEIPEIKNDFYIFGIRDPANITGSDWPVSHDEYTESATGWIGWMYSGSGPSTGSPITITTDNTYVKTGSTSIYFTKVHGGATDTGSFLMRKIVTGSAYLLLNSGDILHLWHRPRYALTGDSGINPKIRIETDDDNYYECKFEEVETNVAATTGLQEYNLSLGPTSEGISTTGSKESFTGSYKWTIVGNPDWYKIRSFCMVGDWYAEGALQNISYYIDGLYFGVPFQYHTSGSASINAYGLRTDIVRNNRINSYPYAKNWGDTLLLVHQDPPMQIEAEVIARPLQVGTKYPILIKSEGINEQFWLMDLEYIWSNNKLICNCLFTNQQYIRIPIPILQYTVQQAIREKTLWGKIKDMFDWGQGHIRFP